MIILHVKFLIEIFECILLEGQLAWRRDVGILQKTLHQINVNYLFASD